MFSIQAGSLVLLTLVTVLTHSLNFAKHGKSVVSAVASTTTSAAPKVVSNGGARSFSTMRVNPNAMRHAVDAALKKFPSVSK